MNTTRYTLIAALVIGFIFLSWVPIKAQITYDFKWDVGYSSLVAGGTDTAGLDTMGPNFPFGIQNRLACPTAGDLDADGLIDFMIANQQGQIFFYKNVGTSTKPHWGRRSLASTDTIKIGKGQNINQLRPTLADIDGDGDLDMLIGSRWQYGGSTYNATQKLDDLHFFRNIGTKFAPVFTQDTMPGLENQQCAEFANPTFVDIDADGDLDLQILGSDSSAFFENTGTATNPTFVRHFKNAPGNPLHGWFYPNMLVPTPNFFDMDGDGDLDLTVIDDGGIMWTVENEGTATAPDFDSLTLQSPPVGIAGVDFGQFSAHTIGDFNNDGEMDLFVSPFTPVSFHWFKGVSLVTGVSASITTDSTVSCNADTDAGLTAVATDGTGKISYAWSTGDTVATITGLGAGTYTVTITDSLTTDSASVTLTEPAVLSAATVVDSNVTCFGFSDGGASASATGGTTSYNYAWSNSATNASITGVIGGKYTVTITDANGCTDTASVTITAPTALTAATVVDSNTTCNGFSDGGASASATGGTGAYGYAWSNAATNASITGVIAGTYKVTITDANGCTDTSSVSITEPAQLVAATVVDSNISCNTFSDGGASASATGGTMNYSYAWSNAATNASITGVVAGNYKVTVTDANGCTDTASAMITQPAVLNAAAVIDSNISCNALSDGGASASATGGTMNYSYAWSNSATNASITGVTAGTYKVTVTDANGCTDTASATITQPAVLNAAAIVDSNVTCFGSFDGGATASATGGTMAYNYAWSNSATNASITGVVAGTYKVTVTDANGCTDTASATIVAPTTIVAASVVDSNASCNAFADGGATASATGGALPYNYVWSNAATNASITGVVAGTYKVTITDDNGCIDTSSVTITEPTQLVAVAVVDSNISCNTFSDGGASASATGGTPNYSYAWSNAGTMASITGVVAGTYKVTVTDGNGCTDTASAMITQPAALNAIAVVDSNISCNTFSDGGASASATGGTMNYSYAWSNSATNASITGVVAGTYKVTVTDANGCTDTASAMITQPAVLNAITVVDSNVSCFGFSNGGATASASGGTANYSYAWSNSATNASITGVVAGTYKVTATDANGCTDTASVTITTPATVVATAIVDSNISCFGLTDGGASVSATGGTGAYKYAWSNGDTTAAINGLQATNYTVTVTDANGCTGTDMITITEPTLLTVSTTVDSNVTCKGLTNGGATASSTGGTGTITWSWSNSTSMAALTNVAAGKYNVTATDANGCTDTSSATISEPDSLTVTTAIDSNVTCFGYSNGGVTATVQGGTANYNYGWSNSATNSSITGVTAGKYTVTVTDDKGCTDTASSNVSEPAALTTSTVVDSNVTCNGFSNGGASTSPSGGTTNYSYAWSNSATNASITGVTAAKYYVTITDANGCTLVDSATVTEPMTLVASTVLDSNVSCKNLMDGGATASTTGGTGTITWNWSNSANTATITGVAAGFYAVTATDANGCTDSASITITEPDSLIIAAVVDSNVTCNGLANGGATASAMGGTMNYSWNWSNGDQTASISQLTSGLYRAVVIDANGCTDTTMITITQPTVLVASTMVDSNVTCFGLSDGGATASAMGGTPGYSYAWSNNDADSVLNGVPMGTYMVTVTDANGCVDMDTLDITEPDSLQVSAMVTADVSCFGLTDGTASSTTQGGTQPYSYDWDSGDTTSSLMGKGAGTYYLIVTDSLGCMDEDSITITEPADLIATIDSLKLNLCKGDSMGIAYASAQGGTPNYTYLWSDGQGGDQATSLPEGAISVTVTDDNGCVATAQDMMGYIHELPVLDLGPDIDVEVSSVFIQAPDTFATYLWSNGDTTSSTTITTIDTVSLIVMDSNGCSTSDTVHVSLWPASTEEYMTASEIQVYPNPSNGIFTIQLDENVTENVSWTIYSLSGRMVRNGEFEANASQNYTMDMTDMPQGSYMIHLNNAGRQAIVRVMIR
ncbi:VCBS repeat-containing protein [bacterium SCSIO 12741]|nr:VCBS repeat-containing protein [bacterium SCSIO 12741]